MTGTETTTMTTAQTYALETTKRADLVTLAGELAKHGTKAQRAERLSKLLLDDLRAHVATLALRAQRGRVVHLCALGGQPACEVERGRELTGAALLTTPITTSGPETTCTGCRDAAGLLSDEEAAAFREAETARIAAEEAPRDDRPRRQARAGKSDRRGSTVRKFTIAMPLGANSVEIVFPYRGERHLGRIDAEGQVYHAGQVYSSPSTAATAITGNAVNGWRRWRVELAGDLLELDALRVFEGA